MWKFICASVIGTSHAKSDTACQDNCRADVIQTPDNSGYFVAIVSDGAGSAQEGGRGSELACETAIASIKASLESQPNCEYQSITAWINDIRQAIALEANEKGLTMRDFACTLLGGIFGKERSIFFQVGDGAIVASIHNVQGIVFWPETGEYANMTHFVTDQDVLEHLQTRIIAREIEEVVLFSDGIQRLSLSFASQVPHYPFFDPMLKTLRAHSAESCNTLSRELAAFLNSEPVNKRTDDDKTLVLATRITA